MKKLIISSLLSIGVLSTVANAQDPYSVGASVGTTGFEAEYSRMIMPEYKLAVRVTTGGFSYSDTYSDTDVDYDTDLSQFNLGAILEYHPMGNGFYIGAGAYLQNDDYTLEAKAVGGTYEFNGHEYDVTDLGSVTGEVENLNSFVPYIGIGYDASLFHDGQWFFTLKAGAWYQGTPKVNLTAHDCNLGSAKACQVLQDDLDYEEEQINNDIKDYKWWPVIQIGVSYRF
jgi:hypothetical protein